MIILSLTKHLYIRKTDLIKLTQALYLSKIHLKIYVIDLDTELKKKHKTKTKLYLSKRHQDIPMKDLSKKM